MTETFQKKKALAIILSTVLTKKSHKKRSCFKSTENVKWNARMQFLSYSLLSVKSDQVLKYLAFSTYHKTKKF